MIELSQKDAKKGLGLIQASTSALLPEANLDVEREILRVLRVRGKPSSRVGMRGNDRDWPSTQYMYIQMLVTNPRSSMYRRRKREKEIVRHALLEINQRGFLSDEDKNRFFIFPFLLRCATSIGNFRKVLAEMRLDQYEAASLRAI